MPELVITLAPGADLKAVSRSLAAHGFAIGQELAELAIVTGHADPASIAALRALEGVAAVEESQPVHIAPVSPSVPPSA